MTGLIRNEDRSSRSHGLRVSPERAGDVILISARRKVNSCIILPFKYTCVPPSAAVALSRVRAISPWELRKNAIVQKIHVFAPPK
jgi:hypothetical protein